MENTNIDIQIKLYKSIIEKLEEDNLKVTNELYEIKKAIYDYNTKHKYEFEKITQDISNIYEELKTNSKQKKNGLNKTIIIEPKKISDELADFINVPRGQKMYMSEVNKIIKEYIKEHNLTDKKHCAVINPDDKLSKLLKIKDGKLLTYFNFITYLKKHFIKE